MDDRAARHRALILAAVPGADVVVSGGSSIGRPGDLDLVAVVDDVAGAADALRTVYPTLHEREWRNDWAAFRDGDVDVVVTRKGTRGYLHHVAAWEHIRSSPELLEQYARLDRAPDREEAKARFFEHIVAQL